MYGTAHEGSAHRVELRNFCRRRPTPRDDLKAPYFRNRQHLPCTREPPRSGGGSNSTPPSTPACALKFGAIFAAGGQHATTTSREQIPSSDWISRASASRIAAAEPITRRIEFPRARSNLIFCRRRPTLRYDLKASYFRNRQHLPCTREPPRSGGRSNSKTYSNSANQHPATASKQRILPNTSISHAPASRREAAAESITSRERAQIRFFAAGGQHPATTSKHRISPTASISRPPAA
ncbi:hypothetical protein C8R43DRAFT_1135951 [Mycena crocata]|nr:hypothetical protein C8R43DRAFT_1135951 [Mycena crocata]